MTTREDGLRGVDELTTARLLVREFVVFSARNPHLHRIITQECKVAGPQLDWLVAATAPWTAWPVRAANNSTSYRGGP